MTFLSGVISDKLRRLMTKDEILNNPRMSDTKPMPKSGVQGIAISKSGRRVTKK